MEARIKTHLIELRDRLHSSNQFVLLEPISWFVWASMLVALPVTSSPLVKNLLGGSTVNPLSGLFLAVLVVTWLIPHLLKDGRIPVGFGFLLAFAAAALMATLIGHLRGIFPWKGQTALKREIYAWIPMLSGIAFYLVTITIVRTPDRLRKSLKWITAGALVMMLWSLVQVYFILFEESSYPGWVYFIHRSFSTRDIVHMKVVGLAYEPSWFAHQLNILYFPIWIGFLLSVKRSNSSLSRYLIPITALSFVSAAVLLLAGSRIGLIGFIAIFGFVVIYVGKHVMKEIRRLILSRFFPMDHAVGTMASKLVSFTVLLLLIGVLAAFAYGFFNLAVIIDPRLERLTELEWGSVLRIPAGDLYSSIKGVLTSRFANRLMFGERFVYWEAAYHVFSEYPFLGVGLGNAGFYFRDTMPAFAWALPEVVDVMRDGAANFPNAKNLWLRLLAETGVVGFSFFINWLGWLLIQALRLKKDARPVFRAVGIAGILGVLVMIVEGFSLDTFGLPYYWILFGLVTAAASMAAEATAAAEDSSIQAPDSLPCARAG